MDIPRKTDLGQDSVASVRVESLDKTLVVKNVTVVEVTKRVEVPLLVDVPREQIRYVTHEEDTTKYNTLIKETLRYVVKEQDTTKFAVREVETLKYIPREVEVSVPKFVEKEVEIPIKKEVPIEVAKIVDLAKIQEIVKIFPELKVSLTDAVTAISALIEDVNTLKGVISEIKDYKFMEKIIEVPRIEYQTVVVERPVYKDVLVTKNGA
mgnify:CR=1 FL=1